MRTISWGQGRISSNLCIPSRSGPHVNFSVASLPMMIPLAPSHFHGNESLHSFFFIEPSFRLSKVRKKSHSSSSGIRVLHSFIIRRTSFVSWLQETLFHRRKNSYFQQDDSFFQLCSCSLFPFGPFDSHAGSWFLRKHMGNFGSWRSFLKSWLTVWSPVLASFTLLQGNFSQDDSSADV